MNEWWLDGALELAIFAALFAYLFYFFLMRRVAKKEAIAVVHSAAFEDDNWNAETLKDLVKQKFSALQASRSTNDIGTIKELLHTHFHKHYLKGVNKYAAKNQFNHISNIEIDQIEFVQAHNASDDGLDRFTVHIDGFLDDEIVDDSGKVIEKNGDRVGRSWRQLDEYWQFSRAGSDWLIKNITENKNSLSQISADQQEMADGDFAIEQQKLKRKKTFYRLKALGLTTLLTALLYLGLLFLLNQ